MNQTLTIAQLVVSVLLIASILLQQRGDSLGSAFGGEDTSYATRRGMEKYLFWASIAFTVVFIALALLNFLA